MPREEEKLKLGEGAAFVKGRLKRLRQEDETWEADALTLGWLELFEKKAKALEK